MVDASVNEALLSKSYNKAYEILERITNNNYHWLSTGQVTARGTTWVHNIDTLTILLAQVTSLTNMVKVMTTAPANVNQVAEVSCVYCGAGHLFDNFPGNPASINYVGSFNRQNQNNPYSNTYNPGWRQHPNFHGVIRISLQQYLVDKTDLLTHLDFISKIKSKKASTMINSATLKL